MLALLESSEARVHLDARRPGVRLPPNLLSDGHVCLDYGYALRPPIHDLTIDDTGISATLSFRSMPTATFIPWSAIFLIANFEGRGSVWQNDLPADQLSGPLAEAGALAETETLPGKPALAEARAPAAARAPRLVGMPSERELPSSGPVERSEDSSAKPRPSHLKLVK